MIFYKFECAMAEKFEVIDRMDREAKATIISSSSEEACIPLGKNAGFYIAQRKGKVCTVIGMARMEFIAMQSIENACREYLEKMEMEGKIISCREITKDDFIRSMRLSERNSFLEDMGETLDSFRVDNGRYDDSIIETVYSFKNAKLAAENILCGESLNTEIERIFSNHAEKGFAGHPVHYIISSDDTKLSDNILKILLGSLYSNGRLLSRRYACCDLNEVSDPRRMFARGEEEGFDRIYRSLKGGTVLVNCSFDANDSEFANVSQAKIQKLCEAVKASRQNVLTVFVFPRNNEKIKNRLLDNLMNITFVELTEETVFRDKAKKYLKNRAKEKGITNCASLYKMLPKSEKGTLCTDLNKLFDKWYDQYIRTDIFPQYAVLETHAKEAVKPKGDAFKDLQEMIGLTAAKSVIAQAIDYYKVQKLFKEKGLQQERPAMHMCFTGNPGTAKTSAARLIAQIMKDNNLLSTGDLIEVGRADLVGMYLGWTAKIVKDKFKKAKGSVLFIDEAYSLVDDRDGLYGDEAINAIVQEMENAREDTIVIFAGYPDKMEGFLQKNPGLKSRIAFHVDFPDYNDDELMDILRLMLKKQNLSLADGADEKISKILVDAAAQENFGNGRFVRNLLEKARLKQATRLVAMDWDAVTPEIACTLTAEDFEVQLDEVKQKVGIGFGA